MAGQPVDHIPFCPFLVYVRSVIAEAAGGPFVLANSDSCPPGVSFRKFELVAELARSIRP